MEAVQTLAAPVDAPANTHKWLIAIAVMLGCILELLDTTIVNVSLPHMQGSFSASVDEITWVVTSYLVANGIMIPLTGWISGRFGRKRYFLFSVSTFVLASACCGLAQTLDQIVLFRLLQGFAGAAMQPSSQAIMMETFPPEEQQMAMATWSMGISVAPVLGPTIGGWITDNWSWRWTFYINVPIGLIAIVMVSLFLHDPPYLKRLNQRIDYFGIMLLTLGGLCLGERTNRGGNFCVARAAQQRPSTGVADLCDPAVYGRHGADGSDGFPGLRHQPNESDFSPGVSWLHRMEGRLDDGAALDRFDRRADLHRSDRAPRRQHPPIHRAGLCDNRDLVMANGEMESRRRPLEHRHPDFHQWPGYRLHFRSTRGDLSCDCGSRAHGSGGQLVQHDTQYWRLDRNLSHHHALRHPPADQSKLSGRAYFCFRCLEAGPRGAADAGQPRLQLVQLGGRP